MPNFAHIFLLVFVLISACAPVPDSNTSSSPKTDVYSPDGPVELSADLLVQDGISFTEDGTQFLNLDLNLDDGEYVYSLKDAPEWLEINSSTGELSGTPSDRPISGYTSAVLVATFDSEVIEKDIRIGINGDPLREYSWHLKNSGQATFAARGGVSGFDINVFDVYNLGFTGSGVRVAVSDTGVEINHDDLSQNVLPGLSRDYTQEEPLGKTPVASSAHGTAVSGIIAARGWNNVGGMGVAPLASIAGFQFLDSSQTTQTLIDQASGNFDIFNFSYGDTLEYDTQSDPDYVDHLRSQVLTGRNGKGIIFVKAAGNEFILADDYDDPTYCVSHNANLPFENESPFMLVVGAVNADGEKASYSNAGSNLWITAPGGEHGITDPAILTTDLPTCFKGYSKAEVSLYNEFEYGHKLNQQCNYTSIMNGTSSATPMVSGVVALIMQANPDLTWRDIKHILAVTARKVDASTAAAPNGTQHPSTGLGRCPSLTLDGHAYELGWVTNRAGIDFNNLYGFGLVDAKAAVELAKDLSADPLEFLPMPAFVETNPDFDEADYSSDSISKTIPDNDASGVSDTITVSDTGLTVETIQVHVSITHPRSGQLGIELTGPGGPSATKSILLNINNSLLLGNDADLDTTFATHAFYGEEADGDWTIKVIDGASGSSGGKLNSWQINILGH